MTKTLLIGAATGYLIILAGLYVFQRSLQYFPDARRLAPSEVGLSGVEELTLATADGETLVAWYVPAPPGRPTIVYFHGNGGALWGRFDRLQLFRETGYGVFMVSYRGYGGSSGSPTEAGLAADAAAAVDHLGRLGIDPVHLVYFGESLGTGVAVRLAVERPPSALVLEAPFTSASDVAAGIYWWLPVRLLMKDRFESASLIRRIRVPVAVIHGDRDRVVPFVLGRRLFEAANQPKELFILKGEGHNTPLAPATWRQVAEFLDRQAGTAR